MVSWPATSRVMSSSRSSWSDIGEPSSWRASSSIESTSSRSLVRVAALVDQLEQQLVDLVAQVDEAGQRAEPVEEALQPLGGRAEAGSAASRRTRAARRARSRSASRRSPGSRPKTARRMISRVSPCIRGCSSSSGSAPQDAPRARSPPRPGPSSRSIRSPWNAGSISLRCSMCASPSSRITEFAPTIGSQRRARPRPGWRTSGGAVKICLISSGSVSITNGGANGQRRVKRLP